MLLTRCDFCRLIPGTYVYGTKYVPHTKTKISRVSHTKTKISRTHTHTGGFFLGMHQLDTRFARKIKQLISRFLGRHLSCRSCVYTGNKVHDAKKKKRNWHKTKMKHHPIFEPRTLRSHGQRPTCHPNMFLVYTDRDRYIFPHHWRSGTKTSPSNVDWTNACSASK